MPGNEKKYCEICGRDETEDRPLALSPVQNWRNEIRTGCLNCRHVINAIIYKERQLRPKPKPPRLVLTDDDKEYLKKMSIVTEGDTRK